MKQKLKNQKGATGADVLVALGVILVAITIVSTLYVNTVLVSRSVVRASGATRIATNIVENINSMLYRNFKTVLGNLDSEQISDVKKLYTCEGGPAANIFNTKVPKGYKVEILVEDIFSNPNPHFDIAKEVQITVTYKVSSNEKNVSLSLCKQLEMCEAANEPDLSIIPLAEGQSYLPIMNVNEVANSTKPGSGWYDYSNRVWARVLVDTTQNIDNIKNGTVELANIMNSSKVYYWIPRFSENVALYKTTNYPIILTTAAVGSNTIQYFTVGETAVSTVDSEFDLKKGIWVKQDELTTNSLSSMFLSTQYGPNAL